MVRSPWSPESGKEPLEPLALSPGSRHPGPRNGLRTTDYDRAAPSPDRPSSPGAPARSRRAGSSPSGSRRQREASADRPVRPRTAPSAASASTALRPTGRWPGRPAPAACLRGAPASTRPPAGRRASSGRRFRRCAARRGAPSRRRCRRRRAPAPAPRTRSAGSSSTAGPRSSAARTSSIVRTLDSGRSGSTARSASRIAAAGLPRSWSVATTKNTVVQGSCRTGRYISGLTGRSRPQFRASATTPTTSRHSCVPPSRTRLPSGDAPGQ